ncbi:unnamed protein product, partial [Aphanomyces euteiches]
HRVGPSGENNQRTHCGSRARHASADHGKEDNGRGADGRKSTHSGFATDQPRVPESRRRTGHPRSGPRRRVVARRHHAHQRHASTSSQPTPRGRHGRRRTTLDDGISCPSWPPRWYAV